MASALAPVPVRPILAGWLATIVTAALLVVGSADGAGNAWSVYVAPAGTCAGESDVKASRAEKARSIACLVNWARVQKGVRTLAQIKVLKRAAALKGQAVAQCGQFSHTPCGTDVSAQVRATGYRYEVFGENLYLGPWGKVSAREVVTAWLASPPHRANLLSPSYRHLGIAPARAKGMLGQGAAVLWTAAFATPG